MRRPDWLIVVSIGALLVGGAYALLGINRINLSQMGQDGTHIDTTFVVANFNYLITSVLIMLVALLSYFTFLRSGGPRVAAGGAIAFFSATIGVFMTTFPASLPWGAPVPRRYADYSEAFTSWQTASTAGAILIAGSLAVLLILSTMVLLRQRKP